MRSPILATDTRLLFSGLPSLVVSEKQTKLSNSLVVMQLVHLLYESFMKILKYIFLLNVKLLMHQVANHSTAITQRIVLQPSQVKCLLLCAS